MLSYDPWLLLFARVAGLRLSTLGLRFGFWALGWFWVWLYMGGPGAERRRPCGLDLLLCWGWQWRGLKWGFWLRVLMWWYSDVVGVGFGAWGVL